MKFFKPEDFYISDNRKDRDISPIDAAMLANEKLNKLIESWPVVYGIAGTLEWNKERVNIDSHKARLAFIEPIVKEPCKHEPWQSAIEGKIIHKCKHCGVKLIADWKTK